MRMSVAFLIVFVGTTVIAQEYRTVYGQSNPGPVMLRKPVQVDEPTLQGKPNPDGIAVVIGNENYERAASVQYAIEDAEAIRAYVVKTLGYPASNILFYPDARNNDFISIFGKRDDPNGLLMSRIRKNVSDVFIYYSGHGCPDVTSSPATAYLLPTDADPDQVRLLGYSLSLLYENLNKLGARSVTVVVDACFSGESEGGTLIRNASPVGMVIGDVASTLTNGVSFASSSGSQISSWYHRAGHSLFTYMFLRALQGDADYDKDGNIVASEIFKFVSDQNDGVPYWALRLHGGRKQNPVMRGSSSIALYRRG